MKLLLQLAENSCATRFFCTVSRLMDSNLCSEWQSKTNPLVIRVVQNWYEEFRDREQD